MNFNDDKNIITIIQNALSNYEKFLLDKQYIFVYYNSSKKSYHKLEVAFTESNYKHLCGISDKPADIVHYPLGSKEIVNSKDFYSLCKKKRLNKRHIILKHNGSTIQKMNILNNIYKIIYKPVVSCDLSGNGFLLIADKMLGLKQGNVCLALKQLKKYCIPVSTLDFNIYDAQEKCFDVILVAYKRIYSKGRYKTIVIEKGTDVFDLNYLNTELKDLFETEIITEEID